MQEHTLAGHGMRRPAAGVLVAAQWELLPGVASEVSPQPRGPLQAAGWPGVLAPGREGEGVTMPSPPAAVAQSPRRRR